MIAVRPAAARGATRLAWLDSRHTFSFGDYYDPAHMGYRALRVLNDDRVAPAGGFPTHGHRDMEIVTYVVEGIVTHRDSLGHEVRVGAGEFQRMTAGTGVRHSEFNPSDEAPLRFLQIWILPEREGLAPSYQLRAFGPPGAGTGQLRLAVSREGRKGSLRIHQDADFYVAQLDAGAQVAHALAPGRGAWLQVVTGKIDVGDAKLSEGDGAAIDGVETIRIAAREPAEILVIDLA